LPVFLGYRLFPFTLADWGKITLPQATATPSWLWVVGVVVAVIGSLYLLESRKKQMRPLK